MTAKTPEPPPRTGIPGWIGRSRHDIMLACHILFAPVLLVFSSQLVALHQPPDAARGIAPHPGAVGATWLLLLACLLLLRALFRKVWLAFFLTGLPVMGLTLVSYYRRCSTGCR
jgi:hypothetical protein